MKKLCYSDFISEDVQAALKKVGDFYSSAETQMAERLNFARMKKRIQDEKNIYQDLAQALANEHNEILGKEDAKTHETNASYQQYLKNKQALDKSVSELLPCLKYEFISKAKVNANDLCALLPLIEDVPE